MNGRRAQPGHARKVVAPLQAPAPHTLSVALGAGGGMGPANARPMAVNGGEGAEADPTPPLLPTPFSGACSRHPQLFLLHLWLLAEAEAHQVGLQSGIRVDGRGRSA